MELQQPTLKEPQESALLFYKPPGYATASKVSNLRHNGYEVHQGQKPNINPRVVTCFLELSSYNLLGTKKKKANPQKNMSFPINCCINGYKTTNRGFLGTICFQVPSKIRSYTYSILGFPRVFFKYAGLSQVFPTCFTFRYLILKIFDLGSGVASGFGLSWHNDLPYKVKYT